MAIEALPQETVNTIGSTQCLTDPNSVVKELVDNAIDANATAVAIEISANTLDKILVKDDGLGIAPDDRKLVCKRYCTSKIRTLADLHGIGGASMGFRGEALASAVDLSKQVVVTTRIDGEPTAFEVTLNAKDHQVSEKRVSQPIGTTICISDFLKNVPVRRQTALKERTISSQLAKIKKTLQAYALARPYLRFTFRVPKAKSDKYNWVYAPKSPRVTPLPIALPDAAIKIFGAKAADQCQFLTWVIPKISGEDGAGRLGETIADLDKDTYFMFQALLPKPEFREDLTGTSAPHQFLSIDGRPVSSLRGVPKQLVSRFKKAFKRSRKVQSSKNGNDPFLCLNIACQPGSYDANIEPAKDDVLFDEPDRLLEAAEAFFAHVYGAPSETSDGDRIVHEVKTHGFDLLLSSEQHDPARKSKNSALCQTDSDRDACLDNQTQLHSLSHHIISPDDLEKPQDSKHRRPFKPSKNTMDEDISGSVAELRTLGSHDDMSPAEIVGNPDDSPVNDTASNPWAIARLSAAMRQPSGRFPDTNSSTMRFRDATASLPSPHKQPGDLMTSPSSMQMPTRSAERRRPDSMEERSSSPPFFPFPDQRRGQNPNTDSSPQHARDDCDSDSTQRALDSWLQRLEKSDSLPASNLAAGTPLNQIPTTTQKSHPRPRKGPHQSPSDVLRRPFVPPCRDERDVGFFSPTSPFNISPNPHRNPKPKLNSNRSNDIAELSLREDIDFTGGTSIHPDLEETMEYERQKQQAMLRYRAQEKEKKRVFQATLPRFQHGAGASGQEDWDTGMPSPPHSSPHRNRYLKAKAALHNPLYSPSSTEMQTPALTPSDPRARLLKSIQDVTGASSQTAKRSSRSTLHHLPFETTAPPDYIHELHLVLPTSIDSISKELQRSQSTDAYAFRGYDFDAFADLDQEIVTAWQERLKALLPPDYAPGDQAPYIDLSYLLADGQESIFSG